MRKLNKRIDLLFQQVEEAENKLETLRIVKHQVHDTKALEAVITLIARMILVSFVAFDVLLHPYSWNSVYYYIVLIIAICLPITIEKSGSKWCENNYKTELIAFAAELTIDFISPTIVHLFLHLPITDGYDKKLSGFGLGNCLLGICFIIEAIFNVIIRCKQLKQTQREKNANEIIYELGSPYPIEGGSDVVNTGKDEWFVFYK